MMREADTVKEKEEIDEIVEDAEAEGGEKLAEKPKFDTIAFFDNIHLNYNLSRLKEPSLLTAALRLVVRHLHPTEKTITFPILEEVDRINLRASGITTNPQELLELLDRVFERRQESFQLKNVYRQFVMARAIYDPRLKFPECYVYIKHP